MKKLLGLVLGLMVSISSAFATDTICNLYNKADGILNGYPTTNFTWNDKGIDTSAEKTIMVQLTPGKKYTVKRVAGGGTPAFRIQASTTSTLSNGQSLVNINSDSNEDIKTFTVPTDAPYVLFYVRNIAGNTSLTVDDIINGFMVVEGTEAPSEYIPYNANCGNRCRNLNTERWENKAISSSDGSLSNNTTRCLTTDKIAVTPGQTYTFSVSGDVVLHEIRQNGMNNEYIRTSNMGGKKTYTWTVPNDVYYIIYNVKKSDNSTLSCTGFTSQFELGDTATDYVAYCPPIKIATTKYNAARFDPLVQTLNAAVQKIKDVVSTTIEQTKAVASLQANKQRRPDDNEECPAGKKCLLVEDSNGTPHWYEIVESYYNPTLPAGFTELAYLQSSGTQYIDTGAYITSNNLLVKTKAYSTTANTSNEQDLFGNQDGTDGRMILGLDKFNSFFVYTRYGTAASSPSVKISAGQNQIFNIETHIENGQKWLVVDGVASETGTATNISNTNKTVQLFANGNATYFFKGRMYYFQMYDNGTLVRDFVPARRESDGVVGMYDTVNNQFYTNAGTGTFTAGPVVLPAGFTTLEYLTSGTDGQYIDTGILFDPTKNFRVVGSVINPDATLRKIILGNYYSQQSETYYSIELYNDGKFRNYMSVDGGSAFNIYSPTAVPADTIAYFDTSYDALAHQTTTTLRYGTTEQTYSGATPETTTVAVHTLKLFNDKRNLSPVYNKPVSIGAVQIYIDGSLVRNFVPAKQGNIVGMFDLANGQFYSGQGGNFTAGPVAQ